MHTLNENTKEENIQSYHGTTLVKAIRLLLGKNL
jgi:hypothetical protein